MIITRLLSQPSKESQMRDCCGINEFKSSDRGGIIDWARLNHISISLLTFGIVVLRMLIFVACSFHIIDVVYCPLCATAFRRLCGFCKREVALNEVDVVEWKGKLFHSHGFVCRTCGCTLPTKPQAIHQPQAARMWREKVSSETGFDT
jgi:hypothetical protein